MTNKLDRRQEKTKQLLLDAVLELVKEKGTDGLTVTEIAKRANVNRGTFYLHYRDVPDMLDKIMDEMFQRMSAHMSEVDPRQIVAYGLKNEPMPTMVRVLEHIREYSGFMTLIFGSKTDIAYARRFRDLIVGKMYGKFSAYLSDNAPARVPTDYLVAYIVSANMGLFMHWTETGMRLSPREVATIMTQIMTHGPIVSSGIMETDPSFKPVFLPPNS